METLVEIKFGSHLFGTVTPQSDLDLKSVYLPDAKSILLQRGMKTIVETPAKGFGERNSSKDIDTERVPLHQYLKLLSGGQLTAIDMLFAPDWALLGNPSSLWGEIVKNRKKVCNKKTASFVGYCRSQANRYVIKESRIHAVRSVIKMLESTKASYGNSIKLNSISDKLEDFVKNEKSPYLKIVLLSQENRPEPIPHLECCDRKVPYFATIKTALELYNMALKDYGARSFLAEKNIGIDWKGLSQAVRVGREALEFLKDCFITFPRPEAKHLLKIKLGELPYDAVKEEIEELLIAVEAAYISSTLPGESDQQWIDAFITDAYKNVVMKAYNQ